MPQVRGQLQVGQARTVGVLLSRLAQVHVRNRTRIYKPRKAYNCLSMYLGVFGQNARLAHVTH